MAERDAIFPAAPHALYAAHRYSPAIRSGGFLFVSGQVGARADGSPEPDLEAQVRLAFENLNGVLAGAGCTFADVVDATIFIVDPERNFEKGWAAAAEFWGEPPYATATAIGATWLAGFTFEIKVIAKLPEVTNG